MKADEVALLRELAATYQVVKGTEYLFSPPREAVGLGGRGSLARAGARRRTDAAM